MAPIRRRTVASALLAALLLVSSIGVLAPAPAGAVDPETEVWGSVEQVAVVASAGADVDLDGPLAFHRDGVTDDLGGLLFREVPAGTGYTLTITPEGGSPEVIENIDVLAADDHPEQAFYETTTLVDGYQYLPTRDGTTLAVNIVIPEGPVPEGGWPTVVEYSGYSPADPGALNPFAILSAQLGYAFVAVNMRGTGCSGGAFDYFEPLQSLDGYDVIETVAAQDWAKDKVGMIGISYPGISQLFVAQTQPPHLEAITPVSVISDTTRSTLYPGGIFNDGFALSWAEDRVRDGKPALTGYVGGQGWARSRITNGDTVCEENQHLRLQAADLLQRIEDNKFYTPDFDYLAPFTFVDEIEAKTLIIGSWQDEQTGGHFPEMLDQFDPDTYLRFQGANGTHAEPLAAPENLIAVLEHLSFFIKEEVPTIPDGLRSLAPVLYAQLLGAGFVPPPDAIPEDRFTGMTYDDALAQFLAEPRVRLLVENGMGPRGTDGGFPRSAFTYDAPSWPIPDVSVQRLDLHDDGTLSATTPAGSETSSYIYDPDAYPRTNYRNNAPGCGSSSMWRPDPRGDDGNTCYAWQFPPVGKSLGFETAPLDSAAFYAGPASVDLWMQADEDDVDLQAVLVEVRPDGQEMYIQSGYLRAGSRALDETHSTELSPRHTLLEADWEALPSDSWTEARVQIFPFAHLFRPGSRIKLYIEAPGGERPLWTFEATEYDVDPEVRISHDSSQPSSLALPLVTGAEIPAKVLARTPSCGAVRMQPCRATNSFTATAPGAPLRVKATRDDGALDVRWEGPNYDGGSIITSYLATANPGAHTCTVNGGECEIDGLTNGTEYTVTVTATNEEGTGPASVGKVATPLATPGVPQAVKAGARASAARVTWSEPLDDGGGVSRYIATASPGGKTCSTVETDCVVTGLKNGKAYTFTVVARNPAGVSPASTPSAAVVPRTTPGAPRNVDARGLDRAIRVRWDAPGNDGGADITRYTATASPGGETCTTSGGTACTIDRLRNGRAYTVTVRAKNIAGFGPKSDPSKPATPHS